MTPRPELLAAASILLLSFSALAAPPSGHQRQPRPKHAQMRTPGPEVGTQAPDFTLKVLNSDETVQLSERMGKRPVVLVFGSYT